MNQDSASVYTPNGVGDQDSKRLHTERRWGPGQRKRLHTERRWGPGQQASTHRTALGTRTAQAPPPPIVHTPVPCIIEAGREEQVYLKRKEYAEHNRRGESVL